MELNGLYGGLADPGLLRTLWFSDTFTALINGHLGVLPVHFSEALEKLIFLRHALAAGFQRG